MSQFIGMGLLLYWNTPFGTLKTYLPRTPWKRKAFFKMIQSSVSVGNLALLLPQRAEWCVSAAAVVAAAVEAAAVCSVVKKSYLTTIIHTHHLSSRLSCTIPAAQRAWSDKRHAIPTMEVSTASAPRVLRKHPPLQSALQKLRFFKATKKEKRTRKLYLHRFSFSALLSLSLSLSIYLSISNSLILYFINQSLSLRLSLSLLSPIISSFLLNEIFSNRAA